MSHPDKEPLDTSLPEDGSIPAFLRRTVPSNSEEEVTAMKTDDTETTETEVEAPATKPEPKELKEPKATPKAKPHKPAVKAKGNGHAKPKGVVAAKVKKAASEARKPAKAKAKKAERTRDPAKLDAFGFRKGSIKSKAAAMYAKGKGATLAEVKEALGSVQFNLLTELEEGGFTVGRNEAKNYKGRAVTRYKLHPKE